MAQHLAGILRETVSLWLDMGIYLVFGFAVAGALSRLLKREAIARYLGEDTMGAVAKASLFGIPLPLCSCGVIPVGLSLRRRGASRGAATAFLISTPQTGVDSILVTWAFLGPLFALVRPVAALLNGLLGGGIVTWLERGAPQAAPKGNTGASSPESDCRECNEAAGGRGRLLHTTPNAAAPTIRTSRPKRIGCLPIMRKMRNIKISPKTDFASDRAAYPKVEMSLSPASGPVKSREPGGPSPERSTPPARNQRLAEGLPFEP